LDRGPGHTITLFIKPGEAFGDGRHKTTRVCLEMFDDLQIEQKDDSCALDLGTGNGILAVAASLLGFKTVVLTDLSPEIIAEAEFHGQIHHVAKSWQTHVTDQVPKCPLERGYDLITANILAPVLHQLLPAMAQELSPKGSIILAGFIRKEAGPLRERGKELGLFVAAERECQGWVGLRLQRASESS
jgi:ribosomal protein L11 methyltransferase